MPFRYSCSRLSDEKKKENCPEMEFSHVLFFFSVSLIRKYAGALNQKGHILMLCLQSSFMFTEYVGILKFLLCVCVTELGM